MKIYFFIKIINNKYYIFIISMSSLKYFNNIYVKTDNFDDIITFNDLLSTLHTDRRSLLKYLRENKIYYDTFKQIGNSKGFIRYYKKAEDPVLTSSLTPSITPSIETDSLTYPPPDILQDDNPELNKNYKPLDNSTTSTTPYDILHSFHLEDLLKYSPVMITKYNFKINNYTELFEKSEDEVYKQKVLKYKKFLIDNTKIEQIHNILSLYISTFNTIILKMYGRIYDTYENELNKMDFENIKYDNVLGVYYTRYLNQKNQLYKSRSTLEHEKELYEYISENYESAILEKKLLNQQKVINDSKYILHKKSKGSDEYTYKINTIRITMDDIQNPSLEFLVNIVQHNDLLSDFYFGQTYGKIAIAMYKILIKCIYNFKKYKKLCDMYKVKNLDTEDENYKILLKLKN